MEERLGKREAEAALKACLEQKEEKQHELEQCLNEKATMTEALQETQVKLDEVRFVRRE